MCIRDRLQRQLPQTVRPRAAWQSPVTHAYGHTKQLSVFSMHTPHNQRGNAARVPSTHAHMVLLFVALQRCTIDFTYFMAMQFYIGFFGLAAVAALGEQISDASLEHTAASKGVMPGSASSAANTISGACSSHVPLEEVVDAIDLQKVARGFPRGVSAPRPGRRGRGGRLWWGRRRGSLACVYRHARATRSSSPRRLSTPEMLGEEALCHLHPTTAPKHTKTLKSNQKHQSKLPRIGASVLPARTGR